MITRKGKIARLPNNIRETLNNRLNDGETGATLVEWLNSLPEVQQILTQHFQCRPITEQNLSEWKQGGFLDWRQSEETGASAENLLANSHVLKGILGSPRPITCLIPELAVTLAGLSRTAASGGLTDPSDQKCLFKVADRILRLQHAEQREEKLSLERRRMEALERRHRDAWIHTLPKTVSAALGMLKGAMKSHGHTKASADAAMTALINYFGALLQADSSIPAAPPVPAACGEREARPKSDHIQVPKAPIAPTPASSATTASESAAPMAKPSSPEDPSKSDHIKVPEPPAAATQAPSTSPASELQAPMAQPSSAADPTKSNQLQVPTATLKVSENQSAGSLRAKVASTDPTTSAVPTLDPSILSRWTDGIEDVPEFFPEYDESRFRDLVTA